MRASLLAPMYLSVSWVLTVSYQLFTDTAVKSLATFISIGWSAAGTWLTSNVSIIVFIYAFTWIFVLSSVVPSMILGRQRSVIMQYIFVLTLTLVAFYMADILQLLIGVKLEDLLQAANLLTNPVFAGIYLAIPYIFMIGLDYRARKQAAKRLTDDSSTISK